MDDTPGVLIVEDQYLLALDLEYIVASAGYAVVGIAAERADVDALPVAPRVALVDVNLRDGATGVEIARALAERHGTRIIFVTANPAQIERPPATAVGFIMKPFNPATVQGSLGFALGTLPVPPRGLQSLS